MKAAAENKAFGGLIERNSSAIQYCNTSMNAGPGIDATLEGEGKIAAEGNDGQETGGGGGGRRTGAVTESCPSSIFLHLKDRKIVLVYYSGQPLSEIRPTIRNQISASSIYQYTHIFIPWGIQLLRSMSVALYSGNTAVINEEALVLSDYVSNDIVFSRG